MWRYARVVAQGVVGSGDPTTRMHGLRPSQRIGGQEQSIACSRHSAWRYARDARVVAQGVVGSRRAHHTDARSEAQPAHRRPGAEHCTQETRGRCVCVGTVRGPPTRPLAAVHHCSRPFTPMSRQVPNILTQKSKAQMRDIITACECNPEVQRDADPEAQRHG